MTKYISPQFRKKKQAKYKVISITYRLMTLSEIADWNMQTGECDTINIDFAEIAKSFKFSTTP